jgi:hypothetical protein
MRMGEGARALALMAALEALPEQFAMGLGRLHGEEPALPEAAHASPDEVRALVDRAERQRLAFSVRWTVSREVALEHAADLDEQLEDAIVALSDVFAPLTDGGPPPAGERSRLPAARGREARHAAADDDRKGGKRRARALERDDERERDRGEREREADVEPDSVREHAGPVRRATSVRTPGRKPLRAGLRRRPIQDDTARGSEGGTIDKGSRVRVLEGPFAGKVGVVHELDGKGGARVMLGLLAVRLAVKDLALSVERRSRPLLSSSHRKPLPVRS